MSKLKTQAELEAQCHAFNQSHPIGTEVYYHQIIGRAYPEKLYKTACKAFVMSGHTAVIFLEYKAGCVALDALTDAPNIAVGQVWKRRNGTEITIERIIPAGTHGGHVEWLSGSGPRSMRVDQLQQTCTLVREGNNA